MNFPSHSLWDCYLARKFNYSLRALVTIYRKEIPGALKRENTPHKKQQE